MLQPNPHRPPPSIDDLAVDRSGCPSDGTVHVAWTDGSLTGLDGLLELGYGFSDILASRSTDADA